ncbi:MAG: hypothetical protein KGI00_03380 [Candidatus Micrarchaeota archaeon]|nr:hypothetical protein [Candidatus Micrarchaeota archaeon]MDE1824307.1 hypothetical protein [Candidatus Micrarchaeota archaeon]MDE1849746.1 hypothetical protein [Candidatus Micrarchaeota archaeon]
MELSDSAKSALVSGSVKIRLRRDGMFQQLTFAVKKIKMGNLEYSELFTDRIIDVSELSRIANEVGLPVEAKNGRAFPSGTSAKDFQGL